MPQGPALQYELQDLFSSLLVGAFYVSAFYSSSTMIMADEFFSGT